ncbi:MAG: hypothetical protein ACOYOT_10585 [Bacteroidales bacterium]
MIITVKIETDSPEGKRLVDELRRYPEAVEFIESNVVSEPGVAPYKLAKKSFHSTKEPVNSISAADSAKLAFKKLGEKYNRTFDNKYTR